MYPFYCWSIALEPINWPFFKQSIPHLTELAHKYKDTVEFIGVTSETDKAAVEAFVKKMGDKMDYAVALDVEGTVNEKYMGAYGVSGIPAAFVVDTNGNVSWNGHPMDPEFEKALVAATSKAGSPPAAHAHHYTLKQIAEMTEDQLVHLSAKDLRGICQEYKVDVTACLEKSDYVEAIHQALQSQWLSTANKRALLWSTNFKKPRIYFFLYMP